MAEQNKYIEFNGVSKAMVHEHKAEDGAPFYSVGISPIPYNTSKDGVINISYNDEDLKKSRLFVDECKSDAGKVNVHFFRDAILPLGKISICTFANDEEKKSQSLYSIFKNKGIDRIEELFGKDSVVEITPKNGGEPYKALKVSAIESKVIEAYKTIKAKKAEVAAPAPEVEEEADGPELG